MTRLLINVEGQTEETFVNELIAPYLYERGYHGVGARLVGNARNRERRGGIRPWPSVRADILRHLREDCGRLVTTMVDYYGLPATGDGAWPGRSRASQLPFHEKAPCIEDALSSDIQTELGSDFDTRRFVPFVMMHEFEGYLFSDCKKFGAGIERPDLVTQFQEIRDAFETPEHINDSRETAPSKRILNIIPGYQKPLLGVLAALEVGLEAIRVECPYFNGWIEKLEAWPLMK